ncbi:hypothetical protein HY285_03465 [Candidatus Peregrinibacteria bacterium]|nr:hypothetical protein [Candidatus Peregrinibacteria bacterium]MBI3816574.1 hypothetical protein [Candidatus Peregrinibacteria bacterium]
MVVLPVFSKARPDRIADMVADVGTAMFTSYAIPFFFEKGSLYGFIVVVLCSLSLMFTSFFLTKP